MTQYKNILVICFIGIQGGLQAQQVSDRSTFNNGFQITGQIQLALPQNEFAEVFNGYPAGFGVSLLIPIGKTGLFRIGAEYAWNSMGKEKSLVELYDDAQNVFTGDMHVGTDVRSSHAIARLSPFKGSFRPYVDAFVGWRSYSTDAEVIITQSDGSIVTTSYSLNRDASMSYGYAGGVMVALGRAVFLDGKVQVLRGGNVTYINQSSLVIDNNAQVDFNLSTTKTDVIIPQLGVSFVF